MSSKELTERRQKALKYRNEVLETEPHLTIKFDYPAALIRSRPKGIRSKWKVKTFFWLIPGKIIISCGATCNLICLQKNNIWRFVSTTNLPPPSPLPPFKNFMKISMKIFYLSFSSHNMQTDSFALLSLTSITVQLESVLSSLYSHTTKSIHYFVWAVAEFSS